MQYKTRLIMFFSFVCMVSALALGLGAYLPLTAVLDHDIPVAIAAPSSPNALISFDANATPTPINMHNLGTNLPMWLGPNRTENGMFIGRTQAASPTIIRIPGGTRSNGYDWLACETGVNIEGEEGTCWSWGWGLRPTDFINFLQATDAEAIFTVNQNGSSKEAAALVAFFNGDVNDNTPIGIDIRGRNWLTVAHWAQLRSTNGNPDPINIQYWEIGNETWGGHSGTDCEWWGWEDVWTCDGTEYVEGIGGNTEGYTAFRNTMRTVDPSIMVGAVGVSPQDSWSNWGNEVIAAAGDVMDFYVIHKYAYSNVPSSREEALTQPQAIWEPMMDEYEAVYAQHYPGESPPPVTVTEYNLFSVQDRDTGQWMTQAVNMLFVADSIGQMMENDFAMANQWNIANGAAGNGTDYGWLDATTYERSPQYYAFPMWARFGDQLLPVSSSYDAATTLSVYAGRIDPSTVSLLVINKTGGQINAPIQIDNMPSVIIHGQRDVVQAASLSSQTVTFNGNSNPSDDLSNAPSTSLGVFVNGGAYPFPPYSITLLRLGFDEFIPTDFVYLPIVLR